MKSYLVVMKDFAGGDITFTFLQRFNNKFSAIHYCNEMKELHPTLDFEVLETCYIPLARYVNLIGDVNDAEIK